MVSQGSPVSLSLVYLQVVSRVQPLSVSLVCLSLAHPQVVSRLSLSLAYLQVVSRVQLLSVSLVSWVQEVSLSLAHLQEV